MVSFLFPYQTGRNLFGTLRQVTASGTPGLIWDTTNTTWSASPATRKVTLTEGTSPNLGIYTGGVATALGSYTGLVLKQIHDDDDADNVVAAGVVQFVAGVEQRDVGIGDVATAAQVRSELNSNPVPASNMRGTDNALLAASYTAPDNAGISAASVAAVAAQAAAESVDGKLTASRAGYLDNLSGGAVATAAAVSAIQNSTRTKFIAPAEQQIPGAGLVNLRLHLMLFDATGNMEAPDATPTVAVVNAAGTSREGNLGTVTLVSTGHYYVDYTVSDAHAEEQLIFTATILEGGATLKDVATVNVVSVVAGSGFTTADRSQLGAIYNKLPSKSYLAGTAAADGDLNLDEQDGDRAAFKADVSLLATAAGVSGVPAAVQAYINANGGIVASNMRGTDAALTAAAYTAPDNAGIAAAASSASSAASSAATAAAEAADAASDALLVATRLTAGRAAALDYLDAAITSRSTFDATTDEVTLAAGHGLGTSVELAAIQARTDLIPDSPAAVGDIVSAASMAAEIDSVLTLAHGAGDWDAFSDATLANQQTIIAQLGQVAPGTPSSVVRVSPLRTWVIPGDSEEPYAANIVTVKAGSTLTLAMDFSNLVNPGTAITTVSAAVDISGNGLTTSSLAPSQSGKAAHFNVSPAVAGVRHELRVDVATTDGQTIRALGVLRVE